MQVAWHPLYNHHVPEGHRFPMVKYDLVRRQLLHHGIIEESDLIQPGVIADEAVLAAHDEQYLKRFKALELTPREQRVSGFEHDVDLVLRELIIAEGTRLGVEQVLKGGDPFAFNIAGGTHHAYRGHGEGFCMLNDQAIGALWAVNQGLCEQVLILDLDVHQGNGTAKILEQEDRVYTVSVHGKSNYPFHKEKSDLDVELGDGVRDEEYLEVLGEILTGLEFIPELIMYQAGVDIIATDKLGKLSISPEGVRKRDQMVFEWAMANGVKVVTSLGGGYSPDIKEIVDLHCGTFEVARGVME